MTIKQTEKEHGEIVDETCINSDFSNNWIVFNDYWFILILLENLDSKLFSFFCAICIQMNIIVYKSILQYRNKYFNIEIKDVITKYQ